jgi:hypothetical protein
MEANEFSLPFKMPSGQTAKVFNLPKDLTLTLVTGVPKSGVISVP